MRARRTASWLPLLGLVACFVGCSSGTSAGDTGVDVRTPDADATVGSDGAEDHADAMEVSAPDVTSETGPDVADAPTCPSPVASDPLSGQRQRCTFAAGARAVDTIGLTEAQRIALPLRHIIVVMKENRSFDHIFGGLAALQPDADVAGPTFVNRDAHGVAVAPFHLTTTCLGFDPDHQWGAMHAQVNGGLMDGFVTSAASSTGGDGHFVMGHYDQTDLPFYYFLANTFAIADHYFPSVRSGTFPDRDYLVLGTSDGVQSTQYSTWPSPSLPTLFDELTAAGVSWGVYADDHPLEECLNDPAANWERLHPWSPVNQLLTDLHSDSLPSVVFVDGRANLDDEHPTANLQGGEAWTQRIYDALVASPAWSSTALLFTYDEAGGFADHVPPSNSTCVARPQDSAYHELGVRVPLIVVSPWARRHFVAHGEKQHTSITRFIETVFGLPALTARDANSDALLDMFDFACPPAPVATAPPAGTGGCFGGATIWLDHTSFASGDPIVVHFAGGPGMLLDWIGVYPRVDTPHSGSTIWDYCANNGHAAPAAPVTSGSITLTAASVNSATAWPLAPGSSWTAYYLVNDGYTAVASVQFDIHL